MRKMWNWLQRHSAWILGINAVLSLGGYAGLCFFDEIKGGFLHLFHPVIGQPSFGLFMAFYVPYILLANVAVASVFALPLSGLNFALAAFKRHATRTA